MRARQLGSLLGLLVFCIFTVVLLRKGAAITIPDLHPSTPDATSQQVAKPPPVSLSPEDLTVTDPIIDLDRQQLPSSNGTHPIRHIIDAAESEFATIKARQSKTLTEAVAHYRQRYGLPPPPNFDKWFAFAQKNGVQMIDEFDGIHESITPFWGLQPATIRSRAQEAIGFDNALIAVIIRHGQVVTMEGGDEWQRQATKGMLKSFVKHLPDMDLAFNIHDEPRVVVPHDDLSRLVQTAYDVTMPAANQHATPRNSWSARPADMNDGSVIDPQLITRFNRFAHQPTWTHSRISCSPNSPARVLDGEKVDDVAAYGYGKLGFVANQTAFSDICVSPTFSETFGFFDRPNAFNIVEDLFPIFSQSKVSSYQDILYPSPWYWFGKVRYNASADVKWDQKTARMYWRGSTTGGFSRDGGWRRQHRQRFVRKINAADEAGIMHNGAPQGEPRWDVKTVPRADYQSKFDVLFSSVGQCDPNDCAAQEAFFEVAPAAMFTDAYKYKYLLDIDGNAFSGRFYAFLESWSVVFKMAIFREWHMDWLRPWVHYVPLSLHGEDWLESVRYFDDEEPAQAELIATASRDWAKTVLRDVDLEVWFFRLLLEYGRVIDDDREIIGFAPP